MDFKFTRLNDLSFSAFTKRTRPGIIFLTAPSWWKSLSEEDLFYEAVVCISHETLHDTFHRELETCEACQCLDGMCVLCREITTNGLPSVARLKRLYEGYPETVIYSVIKG